MAEPQKIEILPKDLKNRDIFTQDGLPIWVAVEDAYFTDEETIIRCKVQHVDNRLVERRWSAFDDRTFEVLRA